jgi:hypothetical protein
MFAVFLGGPSERQEKQGKGSRTHESLEFGLMPPSFEEGSSKWCLCFVVMF